MIENDVWPIIRTFEWREHYVNERIGQVIELVDKLTEQWVKNIQLLVPDEKDTVDMDERLRTSPLWSHPAISRIARVSWNQFTDVLNDWIAYNIENDIWNTMIISPEASSYVSPEAFSAINEALSKDKVFAAWVVIDNPKFWWALADSIRDGFLTNTFSVWKNELLWNTLFWEEWRKWVEEVWPLVAWIESWWLLAPIDMADGDWCNEVWWTREHQNKKFTSKRVRQVNAYLTYLKLLWRVDEKTYNSLVIDINNEEWVAENQELREVYQQELVDMMQNWIHPDYKK